MSDYAVTTFSIGIDTAVTISPTGVALAVKGVDSFFDQLNKVVFFHCTTTKSE
jgi:hypothetical protein